MTTATQQRQQIPNLFTGKITDENGFFTDGAIAFFNQLIVSLQYILSIEGIRVPSQSAATITGPNLTVSGALLYSSDTNKLWVNLNGTFREVVVF